MTLSNAFPRCCFLCYRDGNGQVPRPRPQDGGIGESHFDVIPVLGEIGLPVWLWNEQYTTLVTQYLQSLLSVHIALLLCMKEQTVALLKIVSDLKIPSKPISLVVCQWINPIMTAFNDPDLRLFRDRTVRSCPSEPALTFWDHVQKFIDENTRFSFDTGQLHQLFITISYLGKSFNAL